MDNQQTVEEAAKELVIKLGWGPDICAEEHDMIKCFKAGVEWQQSQSTNTGEGEWTEIKDGCKMPDENVNVLVSVKGKLQVMAYSFVHYGNDKGESGWVWSNCYGDIYGDAEFDDQYEPEYWMPLPKPPMKSDEGDSLYNDKK